MAVDLWSRAREPVDNLVDGKQPPPTGLPTGSQAGRGPTGSTARLLWVSSGLV